MSGLGNTGGFLAKKKNINGKTIFIIYTLTWKKFLLPRVSKHLDKRVLYFELWFLSVSTFSLVLPKLSPVSGSHTLCDERTQRSI